MRNLKRVLSLVLALMMTFSLMVFTTSASAAETTTIPVASTMYDDYDAVNPDYIEAIDVMTAIGIVEGTETAGVVKLNPTDELTRAEATKILTYLLQPTMAASMNNVPAQTQFVDDVQYDHWAASYINFCAIQGIVSGHSPTEFDPNGQLTGVAFGKMLLVALGYDAEKEGFTGNNWTLNVATTLLNAGIDYQSAGINLSAPLTREAAMEMAFLTLQAPMVTYQSSKINAPVQGTNALYLLNTAGQQQRINDRTLTNDSGFTVEFAESQFPSLWLTGPTTSSISLDDTTDPFGRPAHTWTYKNVDINRYNDNDLLVKEYTGEVKAKDMALDINYSGISKYELAVYVDGALRSDLSSSIQDKLKEGSTKAVDGTGNGVQTFVYVDHNPIYKNGALSTGKISIVIINTWLAEVTTAGSNNNPTLKVYTDIQKGTEHNVWVSLTGTGSFQKGDMVKVTMAAPNHVGGDYSKYTVQSVDMAEVKTDVSIQTISLQKITNTKSDEVDQWKVITTTDNTAYNTSVKGFYDANVLYNYNESREEIKYGIFNLYMDNYGNVLGVKEVETTGNYIFVVGWENVNTALGNSIDRAQVITTDGRIGIVNITDKYLRVWDDGNGNGNGKWVDASPSADVPYAAFTGTENPAVNTWFTYSMDGDTYVLDREVKNQGKDVAAAHNTAANGVDISGVYPSLKTNGYANEPTYVNGNEKSVYIVAEANKSVETTNGSIVDILNRGITGIKNANIQVQDVGASGLNLNNFIGKTWRSGDAQDFDTFFIYDDKGFVTYAVTIGVKNAQNASAETILFTGGALNLGAAEATLPNGDKVMYNEYPVIRGGKEETIKVRANVASSEEPLQFELFNATFDEYGYVTKLERLSNAAHISDGSNGEHQILNKENKYAVVRGTSDNSLQLTKEKANNTLKISGGNASAGSFIIVNNSCSIFVKNYNSNKFDSSYTNLQDALDSLNADKGYVAEVAAVCDSTTGYATTLIIVELKPDESLPGSTPGSSDPGPGPGTGTNPGTPAYGLKWDKVTTLSVTYAATNIWETQAAIIAFLEENGFDEVEMTVNEDGEITGVTAKRDGSTVTFKLDDTVIYTQDDGKTLVWAGSAMSAVATSVDQKVDSATMTITLSGGITPTTSDSEQNQAARKAFAGDSDTNKTNDAFKALYDLDDNYGFVSVGIGNTLYTLLVGVRSSESDGSLTWDDFVEDHPGCVEASENQEGIVVRDDTTGKVVFLARWVTPEGVTIDVTDLTLPNS